MLAHGGAQIQIEQTKAALEQAGVTVEPLRWWDDQQAGNILQHFGRPPVYLVRAARQKGMKVAIIDLLTEIGARSRARLRVQRALMRIARTILPPRTIDQFNWESYLLADACFANTPWEAHLIGYLYGTPPRKVHVLPNGVEDVFFQSASVARGPWLLCTATITERKRVLELAEAAVAAKTPLRVLGKPYAPNDPYAQRFFRLAEKNPTLLRYDGSVGDRRELARAYREARGFVLLSRMETRSLSAEEAAACECPLLLSDLPWARDVFQNAAVYCPVNVSVSATARQLKEFYSAAPRLPPPPKPMSWEGVGRQLATIYQQLVT